MKEKKEYLNVFSNMIQQHNDNVENILKPLKAFSFKIKCQRVLKDRDEFEGNGVLNVHHVRGYLFEYLISNSFFLKSLNPEELKTFADLILSGNKDNFIMGSYMIYNLIEEKKKCLIQYQEQK